MSEFVDLMLDGVICQCCVQFLGDTTGCPRSCEVCEKLDASEHTERPESELNIPWERESRQRSSMMICRSENTAEV